MTDLGLIEFELAGARHCLPLAEANEKLVDHVGAEMRKLAQNLADAGLSRIQINEQLARATSDWQRWQEAMLTKWSGLLIRRGASVN